MESLEDFISIGTFIQQLTYYIKITIYINKGTDLDAVLQKCIGLYNTYKTIEASATEGISDEDNATIRKVIKRLNLVLKVDASGGAVDIRKKENQLRMVYFKGHASMKTDNMKKMIEHAETKTRR